MCIYHISNSSTIQKIFLLPQLFSDPQGELNISTETMSKKQGHVYIYIIYMITVPCAETEMEK